MEKIKKKRHADNAQKINPLFKQLILYYNIFIASFKFIRK